MLILREKQVTATSESVIFEVTYFQNSFMTTLHWSAWSRGSDTGCSCWQFGTQVALAVAMPVLHCTWFFEDASQSSACGYLCSFIWTMSSSVQRFGYIQSVMPLSQHDSLCFHCCSLSCGSGCVSVQGSWWLHLSLEYWRNTYDNKANLESSAFVYYTHQETFFFLLLVALNPPCRKVIVRKNWFWVAACNSPTISQCYLPGI